MTAMPRAGAERKISRRTPGVEAAGKAAGRAVAAEAIRKVRRESRCSPVRRLPASNSKHAARPIPGAGADAPLLPGITDNFHRDFAEPFVGIGLRIVGDGVRVAQILADIIESLHPLLSRLDPVSLAAAALRDAAVNAARNRVFIDFA